MVHGVLYGALKRIKPLRAGVGRLRRIGERAWADVWVVSGNERRKGKPLTALIAGHLETKNYIADLLFERPYEERHERVWRSRLLRGASAGRTNHDIAFIDTDAPTAGAKVPRNVFRLRGWVRTELDLSHASECARRDRGIKSDLRKVRKNRLSHDITSDPVELERFYWDMYVPYAEQGFADKAIYMNHESFQAGLKDPELVRVYRDEQFVAGMVIVYHDNGEPHLWTLGVRNGDREDARQGTLAALYLYAFEHLRERGCSHVLLGGVRPFLIDGVLRYKRKWGAHLIPGDDGDPHWLMVVVGTATEAVRDFLCASPLLGEDEQGLIGAVFHDPESLEDDGRPEHQAAVLTTLGIDRVRAVEFVSARRRSGGVLQDSSRPAQWSATGVESIDQVSST